MSPQSILRAHRPVTKPERESPTSQFSSSGGPYWPVWTYTRSASANASLFVSGFMVSLSKNDPSRVPLACRYPAATDQIIQYDCALRFLAMHDPKSGVPSPLRSFLLNVWAILM